MLRYLPCCVSHVDNDIAFYRNKYGFTQQYIADLFQVSVNTVSSWETGQFSPSLYHAMDLAALFKVPVEQLFWRVSYLEPGEHCFECENFSDAGCLIDIEFGSLYGPWDISL